MLAADFTPIDNEQVPPTLVSASPVVFGIARRFGVGEIGVAQPRAAQSQWPTTSFASCAERQIRHSLRRPPLWREPRRTIERNRQRESLVDCPATRTSRQSSLRSPRGQQI